MPGALATGNMVATCYITVIRAFVDTLVGPVPHCFAQLGKKIPDSAGQ
jgi:hypothetical protein